MSASKSNDEYVGLEPKMDKRAKAEMELAQQNKKYRRTVAIIVAIIVVCIAFVAVVNSSLFYTHMTAVKVGDTSYSAAEFSYYYETVYSEYYNTYGSTIDTSTVYSYDEDGNPLTFADYFTEQAITTMTQITALYDEAMSVGYVIDDDYAAEIDSSLAYIELYASLYGYTTDGFLAAQYCRGMDTELYTEIITKYLTAYSYSNYLYESFEYTDEEKADYYAANADSLENITLYYYYIPASAFADLDDDAAAEAAHDAAQTIADAGDLESYLAAADEYAGTEDAATSWTGYGDDISSYYSEWALDAARTEGDTTVVDLDGSGSYALCFVSRDDNDYPTVSVRHILIQAEADDDGEYTEEALQAAYDELVEIYDMWQEDPTEEYFAELADEYSDDSAEGGLYEEIYKGQMVTEFNDFCFADHETGDTGIVLGQSDSYAGYHLIYFVGEGDTYSNVLADEALRSEDFTAYRDELAGTYTVSTGWAIRFGKS
ncbi:MAG: peptidyl-prolyl cis-trans isomerase [Oscillospiraceae bacterium]|nr:peptidyl-prolyl cis-trans isomerase [Oscillospiraceae bacterium]